MSTISSFSSTLADIVLKFFSSAATLSAFGATAARSSRLDARLTKPTRSAKPCDTGTWVETSLSSVIIDWLASPPSVIETMVMSAWAFSPAGSSTSLSLVWVALGRLHDLFAAGAELETIVDRAVERGELGVHRRDQLLQPIDRFAIGLGAGDLVEPLRDALLPRLQRGHFLLPLRLRFRRQQRRRGAGQRLGVRLQSQRLDDLRNVATGDPVEEIANLREHQPGGGAGDDRGSRYRSESEEELGPDSELAS